jgi:hypothetical protein
MNVDNIRALMKLLPADYEAAGKTSGAMRRASGVIKKPDDLMWLMLGHLSGNRTLKNTGALSELSGIGRISNVALMKRLANCNGWFKWTLERLASGGVADYLKPAGFEKYRVLAVDASRVCSGVSNFAKSWNLHFALDIFSMSGREIKITGQETGETLANFKVSEGDLFVGDRIYATKRGIAHCLAGGADFILRLRHDAFSMCSEDGSDIGLAKMLASARDGEVLDIPVCADLRKHGLGIVKLRVCAMKKSEEQIESAMGRIDARDSRKQKTTSPEAKKFNEHIVLVTSLPENIGADEILSMYRFRWQIEVWFKRLKTLLGAGEVPKKSEESMEAWLNGKMVLAILMEVLLSKLYFSPLGKPPQSLEGTLVFHDDLELQPRVS